MASALNCDIADAMSTVKELVLSPDGNRGRAAALDAGAAADDAGGRRGDAGADDVDDVDDEQPAATTAATAAAATQPSRGRG